MSLRRSPLLLVFLLPILLVGCSSFRTDLGKPLTASQNRFREGTSTVHTVLHELGPPNQVSALPDGFTFLYEHSQVGEFQFGVAVNLPVLRFLKFIKAWNYVSQDRLLMTFDQQGLLRAIVGDYSTEDLGGGTSVQLIFSVISLTDASAYRRRADAHSWGAACLRRLPVTLNAEQNLSSGTSGMQLRPAPSYAGQQTLEMAPPKKLKVRKRPKNSEPF